MKAVSLCLAESPTPGTGWAPTLGFVRITSDFGKQRQGGASFLDAEEVSYHAATERAARVVWRPANLREKCKSETHPIM